MSFVKALLFDVFGTVVDWRSGISAEIGQIARNHNIEIDDSKLADEWRARYQPSMEAIRSGKRPFERLDVLHAENLDHVLANNQLTVFTADERAQLVKAWHRLKGWPDASKGLFRLKEHHCASIERKYCSAGEYGQGCWVALGCDLGRKLFKPINRVLKLMKGLAMR